MRSTLSINRKTGAVNRRKPRQIDQRDLRSEIARKEREEVGLARPGINKDLVLLLARLFKNSEVIAKKRGMGLVKGKVTGHSGPATVESVNEQINQQQVILNNI